MELPFWLCWKKASIELTLTTEFMSGMMGTSTMGAIFITRRLVDPEAVARSTITRLTPREYLPISVTSASGAAPSELKLSGSNASIWMGESPMVPGGLNVLRTPGR